MNDIHYGHSLAAGLPGASLTVASQFINIEWLSYTLLACGIILLVLGQAILLVCISYERVTLLRLRNEANAITTEQRTLDARARLCDRIRDMTPDQVQIAMDNIHLFKVTYKLYDNTPLVYGTQAPYSFFYTWLERSDEHFLCPVGTWSEGSKERGWARQITNLFIARGEASEARDASQWQGGNAPARWVTPEAFNKLKAFYLDILDDNHSPTQ